MSNIQKIDNNRKVVVPLLSVVFGLLAIALFTLYVIAIDYFRSRAYPLGFSIAFASLGLLCGLIQSILSARRLPDDKSVTSDTSGLSSEQNNFLERDRRSRRSKVWLANAFLVLALAAIPLSILIGLIWSAGFEGWDALGAFVIGFICSCLAISLLAGLGSLWLLLKVIKPVSVETPMRPIVFGAIGLSLYIVWVVEVIVALVVYP